MREPKTKELRKTRKERILELFSDKREHSGMELSKISLRYGAVIFELRQEGYSISTKYSGKTENGCSVFVYKWED